jgi:uncharacterized RmlC-like cupin family protein
MLGMATVGTARCSVVRSADTYEGKQGLTYGEGISRETTGAQAICMHTLKLPPGARANVHYHESHESAIHLLSGQAEQLWGERLENHDVVKPGDFVYIPAGVPHVVWNPSKTEFAIAVLARTDPNEQESVVLTPELEQIAAEFIARQ